MSTTRDRNGAGAPDDREPAEVAGRQPDVTSDPHRRAPTAPPDLPPDLPRTVTAAGDAPEPEPNDAELPPRLGRYRVLGELGRGGMGIVYLAEDPTLGRQIAIKTLPPAFAADPIRWARFQREAQLLGSLNHPGVTTVHSLEQDGPTQLLTMEVIHGTTLARCLRNGVPALAEGLRIVHAVAVALTAAHDRGVVHRDLKPGNVMLTQDGRVKVLDFGLATSVGTDPADRVGGVRVGTPGYMSPEQIEGATTDVRTDVWALGCLLYEVLTGRPAFPGDSPGDRLIAICTREPDWAVLPAGTPEPVRRLLTRCLAKRPDQRLAGMAEVARDLGAVRDDLERTVAPAPPPAAVGNLPVAATSFVGREPKLVEVADAVERARLVELIGFGGCGKTRLAIETARRWAPRAPDGCWFVDLATVRDPSQTIDTVASTLGVAEQSGDRLTDVVDALAKRSAMVILDNCEHLLAAAAAVAAALLAGCPQLRLLVTSRESLALEGGIRIDLPPMAVPGDVVAPTALWEVDSVRLFIERAKQWDAQFRVDEPQLALVADICRRLDGIPLALELAAARLRLLPLGELDRRLADRFALLRGGSERSARHRTLEALIDWSYLQLAPAEQQLLRRLSVFAGGFTLAAITALDDAADDDYAALDSLTELVDKSLVVREPGRGSTTDHDEGRFGMLETVRSYASSRLDQTEDRAAIERAHLRHFVELAERAAPELKGADQAAWLERLDQERGNLRLALANVGDGDIELGLRLGGALGKWWLVRGTYSEARTALFQLLGRSDLRRPSAAAAMAMTQAGALAQRQADFPEAERLLEAAAVSWRRLGDPLGLALALSFLGHIAQGRLELDRAYALYEECLALRRGAGDEWGIAISTSNLGTVSLKMGQLECSARFQEESLAIHQRRGDRQMVATALTNLGMVYEAQAQLERAREVLEQAIELHRAIGDPWSLANALDSLARVLLQLGDRAAAARAVRDALGLFHEQGEYWGLSGALDSVAWIASGPMPQRAARLLGAAAAVRDAREIKVPSFEQQQLDKVVAGLKEQLGDDRFGAAFQAGADLGLERALDDAVAALSDVD